MTFRSLALVFVGLAGGLLACSHTPSATTTTGAGGGGGSGTGGSGTGGSGACPADAHQDADAGCVASITWAVGPKVPTARNHHHTWIADQGAAVFLYVAGGSDATSTGLTDVERAPANADGTLGAWAKTTPGLPAAIIGAGVALTHGEVILAGGYGLATTWISTIQPDGSMGAWKAGPNLPGAWFHTTAVAFQDFVYVVGGLVDTAEIDTIVRATVAADGSLGAWETITPLPYGLSHHASVVSGSTLYVLGGESVDGVPRDSVISAALAADGSLGPWKTELALPTPVETHSAFVHDGSLYVVGGIIGPSLASSASVTRAPLAADGTVGAWTVDASSALPHARSHVHQTPVRDGWVYSVAGAPTGFPSVTAETDVGTFH